MNRIVPKIIFLSLFVAKISFAQTKDSMLVKSLDDQGVEKQNYVALYFEIGGNGVELSYNLDFRFLSHLALKIGFGAYAENGGRDFGVLITMAHYLFFERQFHVEIGLGTVTELNTQYCGTTILSSYCDRIHGTAFLGFRYQPFWGGFTFRIGYTPFFNLHEIQSSAGLSLGYSFY